MALPEKLYALRKKSGLSQEQLAEALNVSRQAISKWEGGSAIARLPSKRRCAGCRARRSAGGSPDDAAFEPHSLLRWRSRADRLGRFVDSRPVRSRADQRIVNDPHRRQWHFSAALRRGHCRGRGAAAQKYETQINREVSP